MELTAQVLCHLPAVHDPRVLAGSAHFEDAGVYQLDERTALVQTVDFFPPLVDDPFTFGRIAAANSLSDVYAMGGRPLTALNLVCFPDKDLPADVLFEILRGGAERVAAAGAVILGGHSIRDAEIKYGLAVTGLVHPDHVVRNGGARPGDALVLTKPIGSGTLTSAAKKGTIGPGDLAQAEAVMIELNAAAGELMVAAGATAATDVTGFGLLGHAFEMAEAGQVSLEIEAAAVPLMEHTYRLAQQGILTRAHKACRQYLGARLDAGSVDEVLVNILADAQTSGGLLISVPADRVDGLLTGLRARGTACAALIGRVAPRAATAIMLR